jgi:hypothetical protein
MHYHLKLVNLEILELFLSFDFQLVPGDVIYLAGIIIYEVMMLLGIGIKNNRTFPDRLHSDKSFLDEKVQCVVYSGTGDCWALPSSRDQDIVCRRMRFVVQYRFHNGNPLRRWLNTTLPQYRDSIFHRIRIRIVLDNFEIKSLCVILIHVIHAAMPSEMRGWGN